MKLKKIISLGLVATLCLSMFAGCGEKKPDENPGNNDGNSVTPTVTETPGDKNDGEEDVRFVENIYDMGGKTIKIHDNWIFNFLNDDPSEWDRWETQTAAVMEQIEKDYNVNIEILSDIYNLAQNIATSAAAGQVYANIVVAQTDWTSDWVDGGYAADVTTIKNLGLDTNDWVDAGDFAFDKNGVQCAVGFNTEIDPAMQLEVMVFNKAYAEQYGVEDIYELVRNNEWTYDKFEEICLDINTKSNGAVKGILVPGLTPGLSGELGLLSLTNGTDFVISEDGKYIYNGLSDEAVTGLEFGQDLVRQGLFDLETFNTPGYTVGDRTNAFAREGKTLFCICRYPWVVSDVDYRLEDYGIIPLPRGPKSDENIGVISGAKLYYFMEGDPDIEDAAAILVAMANRLSVTDEGFYEYHFNRGYIRDEESYNFILSMIENTTTAYEYLEYVPIEVRSVAVNLDYTVRQVLDETAHMAQTTIDEALNK